MSGYILPFARGFLPTPTSSPPPPGVFCFYRQGRKMLETSSEKERDELYNQCNARWKSEDEVTSREMRKVLRRKMTRLSLDHLNQVCPQPGTLCTCNHGAPCILLQGGSRNAGLTPKPPTSTSSEYLLVLLYRICYGHAKSYMWLLYRSRIQYTGVSLVDLTFNYHGVCVCMTVWTQTAVCTFLWCLKKKKKAGSSSE